MSFWKKSSSGSNRATEVTAVEAPVSRALILICEKCGKKLESDPDKNPSREIQQALKGRIKAADDKGKLRPVLTSCMDVCPEGEITVGISGQQPGRDRFFTIRGGDAEEAAERILEEVRKISPE